MILNSDSVTSRAFSTDEVVNPCQEIDGEEEVLKAEGECLLHVVVVVTAIPPLAHDPRDNPTLLQHQKKIAVSF